ncbi:YgaP family membrane protein [Shewanella algidipiscicola]|uniref:Membrane protein n=1 Tax=Shewanella algidipiscicola TaxID=614070 RepID=A0ABQ4NTF2_9GAMM|nr:DUF2892 domain-containing protein [Shewanella algidipiscicola]GIU02937.1 membrane protein [Shewanella algidipiscicola]
MSIERSIFAFAGFMVLLSLALTALVHHNFIWLTAFVGANLLQSAFTGFCPAAMIMKKLGVKSEAELERAKSQS